MKHDFLDTALKAAYHLAHDLRDKVHARGTSYAVSECEAAVTLNDDETLSVEPFYTCDSDRVVATVRYYKSPLLPPLDEEEADA